MPNSEIKKVYFVRHGETSENASNATQTADSPLSEKGREQAEFLARRFEKIEIDKIFSSDYKRTAETAEKISALKKLPIEFSPLLRERLLPSEVRGKSKDLPEVRKIIELFEKRNGSGSWKYSDEESWDELVIRAHVCLSLIENCPQSDVLVVTHGGILRTMVGVMLLGEKFSFDVGMLLVTGIVTSNTGITLCKFEKNGKNYWTGEPREWRLITWNDHAHLG